MDDHDTTGARPFKVLPTLADLALRFSVLAGLWIALNYVAPVGTISIEHPPSPNRCASSCSTRTATLHLQVGDSLVGSQSIGDARLASRTGWDGTRIALILDPETKRALANRMAGDSLFIIAEDTVDRLTVGSALNLFERPFESYEALGAMESQLTGLLAGFALTVAVMLLERRGSNNQQHRLRDASLYRAAIGVFVLSCGLGTLAAALALIPGAGMWRTEAAPVIHAAIGHCFAMSATTMFYGLYLSLLAAHQSVEYRAAHAVFFLSVVLGFLFSSIATCTAGLQLLPVLDMVHIRNQLFLPLGMVLAGCANYASDYWHQGANHAESVFAVEPSAGSSRGSQLRKNLQDVSGHIHDLVEAQWPNYGGAEDPAQQLRGVLSTLLTPGDLPKFQLIRTRWELTAASWLGGVIVFLLAWFTIWRPDRMPLSPIDLMLPIAWVLFGWATQQYVVSAVFHKLKKFDIARDNKRQRQRGALVPTPPSFASAYLRAVEKGLTANAAIAMCLGVLSFAVWVIQRGDQAELRAWTFVTVTVLQFALGFSLASFLAGSIPSAFSKQPGFDHILYSVRRHIVIPNPRHSSVGEGSAIEAGPAHQVQPPSPDSRGFYSCVLFWRTEESEPGDEYFVMLKDLESTLNAEWLHTRRKAAREAKLASLEPGDEETSHEYMHSEKRDSDSPEPWKLQCHWTHPSEDGDTVKSGTDALDRCGVFHVAMMADEWMLAALLIPARHWREAREVPTRLAEQCIPPAVSVVFFDSESGLFFWGAATKLELSGAGRL